MGFLKNIIHVLAHVIYFLIISYVIVCIPTLFGYKPVVVLSGSMEPTYKVGSIIYYKKIDKSLLKIGDVITFSSNDTLVSHRISSVENDLFATKGDANNVVDVNKVSYQNIYGKVGDISIPYMGYYIKTINDNLYIVMIVSVVILLSEFLLSNIEAFDIKLRKEGVKV